MRMEPQMTVFMVGLAAPTCLTPPHLSLPCSGTSGRGSLTLSCLTTCDTTSLLPVSSPRYASSSNPSLLQ